MKIGVISLKDVSFRFDPSRDWALRKIDLTIHEGEWVMIVGANGSGKSTLIRLMNGLLRPTCGEVCVYGTSTNDSQNLKDIRRTAGMVFQNPNHQIVGMTVEEDAAFGLCNVGAAPDQIEARCRTVLQWLGLYEKKECFPHFLSGGEKQKLAIAGVLVMEPKVILFDESTSMLDAQSVKSILEIMSELHRNGCTIVQVTHEVEEIFAADRLVVLRQGEIRFDGAPIEALSGSSIFTEAGLLPPFAVRMRDKAVQNGLSLLAIKALEWAKP